MEKKLKFPSIHVRSKTIACVMAVMILTGTQAKLPIFAQEGIKGTEQVVPFYTITIPESIDFGTCEKKMTNDIANKFKTIPLVIEATTSNLFESGHHIQVSIASDFKLSNGEQSLDYVLMDADNLITNNETIVIVAPDVPDSNLITQKNLTARLDQSQIKMSGDYTDKMTFTVSIANNNEGEGSI